MTSRKSQRKEETKEREKDSLSLLDIESEDHNWMSIYRGSWRIFPEDAMVPKPHGDYLHYQPGVRLGIPWFLHPCSQHRAQLMSTEFLFHCRAIKHLAAFKIWQASFLANLSSCGVGVALGFLGGGEYLTRIVDVGDLVLSANMVVKMGVANRFEPKCHGFYDT